MQIWDDPLKGSHIVVVVVVSRYMHTSLMGVLLASPYIPTCTLWLKEKRLHQGRA